MIVSSSVYSEVLAFHNQGNIALFTYFYLITE